MILILTGTGNSGLGLIIPQPETYGLKSPEIYGLEPLKFVAIFILTIITQQRKIKFFYLYNQYFKSKYDDFNDIKIIKIQ